MLNWEYFNASDSSRTTVPVQDMVGPFFTIGPDASPYTLSSGNVDYLFQEVNLDYGILVNFGKSTKTNLFVGVGYDYIKQTLTSKYWNADETVSRTIVSPSSFSGAGPQVGMNFDYTIVDGFKLSGQSMASLLIGTMKNSTTYKSVSPLLGALGISPPNRQTTTVDSRTQLVPAFEGKLGLAYEVLFYDNYMFKIDGGYQAQVYLNAIQSVDMGSEVPLNSIAATTVGVYARTFQRTLSNFALAGPYLKIAFGF